MKKKEGGTTPKGSCFAASTTDTDTHTQRSYFELLTVTLEFTQGTKLTRHVTRHATRCVAAAAAAEGQLET